MIGAGGMGEVWKAEDTRLGRVVAIKILPPAVAADAEMIARLRREARTAAQLNHPNIATIHAMEEADGRLFIAMEFVDGESLTNLIKRGISEAELCRIGRSVADALAEAHAKGIVHRDIKPDNIIVSGTRVKVLDFGIAKQVGPAASASDAPTASYMTQQGMILGTIHYMSPEQALGKPLDGRTDIFSLGIILYEAATGRLPFHGDTITETMTQIIRDEPQEPARVNPKISAGLNTIIQRCLRKSRDERYANASELGKALELQLGRASTARYTKAPPTVLTASQPRRRSNWIWIAAVMLLVIGAAVVAMQHRRFVSTGVPPTVQPAPAQTTVSVAAGAPPAAEQPRAAAPTPVAPEPQPEPTPAPAPAPAQISAHDQYQIGEAALLNRNFARAVEQYQLALDRKEELDPRERELARLGIAIGLHNKQRAQELAREIWRRWPGDPDLQRIRREFGGMGGNEEQRPGMRRRLRP